MKNIIRESVKLLSKNNTYLMESDDKSDTPSEKQIEDLNEIIEGSKSLDDFSEKYALFLDGGDEWTEDGVIAAIKELNPPKNWKEGNNWKQLLKTNINFRDAFIRDTMFSV